MRRFFVENLADLIKIKTDFYPFPKEIEHRLSSVLRMKDGDQFELIDGNGLILETAYHTNKNKSGFSILNSHTEEKPSASQIDLAVSIIRRERFELIIEKAVELGVSNLYPMYSEHSKPYGHESAKKLQERWQKIADQALSQCRRAFRCLVHEPQDIGSLDSIRSGSDIVIALHPGYESFQNNSLSLKNSKLLLLVGPEGGFSENDISIIKSISAKIFSLNTSILRTETAAIYMLSVINHSLL